LIPLKGFESGERNFGLILAPKPCYAPLFRSLKVRKRFPAFVRVNEEFP
jgi:hypothetical protein